MKRILVISNACFSDTDSNGRTLAKLFQGFEPECLAQFFVYGRPDFSVCRNYYQVTDRDALQSVMKWKETGRQIESVENSKTDLVSEQTGTRRKVEKTPFSMLAREAVWNAGKWYGENLKRWIDKFQPEVIFISLADNTFLIHFAIRIAKKYNIPIIAYSTESYCFKEFNYMTKRRSVFYEMFYRKLLKSYRKLEKYVSCAFFNTPLLRDAYAEQYSYSCDCLFSPSDIDFIENSSLPEEGKKTVSYLGNLGVGRHKALIQLATALGEIQPGIQLDIYGKLPNDDVKVEMEQCKNICYKGFVSYQEVIRIMHSSTLLVHVELEDEFYNEDLKYAFSTKIADSVCCGTPFLIYANSGLAETSFLSENECAFVADSKEKLLPMLEKALCDEDARKTVVEKARFVRNEYFANNDKLKKCFKK